MIRTGIPFGYLVTALFLLATFLVGMAVLVWGWRRSLFAKWLGAAMCSLVVIVVAADLTYDSALEWNPTIGGDEVVGTWTDHGKTITLTPDHTFTYRAAAETSRGTWIRDDWNLYLHGNSYSSTMRFVQFLGQYRLMTHPPDDPDIWDGDLGFQLAKRTQ